MAQSTENEITLLLVDDEDDIREVLGIFLGELGYRVLTAENGKLALDIFRRENPPIVLSDIKMPVMDGIALLKVIKEESPDTEVIMITGHGDIELAIESLKLEATDFITKPINEDALEIALKRAMEKISMRHQLREYTENLERMVEEKSARLVQIERQLAVGQAIEGLSSAMSGIAGDVEGGIRYFDDMPCFVAIHSPDLKVLQTNQLFRDRLGDKVGANSWEIYEGGAHHHTACPVARTFETGKGQQSRQTVHHRDGGKIPVMVHTAPISDRAGSPELVLEISADMSEVQRLKEQLRMTQERFQQLFDEVPCYISVRDREYRLTAANRLFKEDFDHELGTTCFSRLHGAKGPCADCPVRRTFEDGQPHQAEMVVTERSGSPNNVLVWTAPIRDSAQTVHQVMLMATNITEIRRLQDRLSSLGLMMGSLSHAIKGHLTGLDSGMYQLSRGFAEDNREQTRDGWEVVQMVVGRLRKVVLDILYYAKERELNWERISVNHFFEDVAGSVQAKLDSHGIDLVRDFDADAGEMEIDVGVLRSAFISFIENAVEACVEDASKEKHRIRLSTRRESEEAVFTIQDNGVGMGASALDNIFTLFYSSKGNKGTGLGLFVANKIVQKHGGRIRVDSQPKKGSTFVVTLPTSIPKTLKETTPDTEGERRTLYCV
ncbi:Two-component system sensor histidine kinase [Olavius algarvensis associated proteobacterium Delta 3]|nr:Two-component system sensor histidine kinase [Olavius algarvensis associated proteobacterium Delta 3]CAB5102638.1 Two-component system sensor histidine kinase [Olavius algarvensis associated proteobacterium Delta 3]